MSPVSHVFGASNYHHSLGSGVYQAGMDVLIGDDTFIGSDGVVGQRPADIRDGLVHTAVMSEMVHGAGLENLERRNMRMPAFGITFGFTVAPATQRTAMSQCENVLQLPPPLTKESSGVPWVKLYGYTHLFTPNRPSCLIGNLGTVISPLTASSRHAKGVNVLAADGHVMFVSSSVDVAVWQALGSRDGSETGDQSF